MQVYRANSEISTSEIDSQIKSLYPEDQYSRHLSVNRMIRTFSVPLGTAVTYVGIWLIDAPGFCSPSSVRTCFSIFLPHIWQLTYAFDL